jgi:hypothetical protein
MEDQTIKVKISPENDLVLVIYGVDGTILQDEEDGEADFGGELPSTQDYILAVSADDHRVSYRLRVTIR